MRLMASSRLFFQEKSLSYQIFLVFLPEKLVKVLLLDKKEIKSFVFVLA